MKIAILTSSRADYGIYRPLIKKLLEFDFKVEIIVFGTHLSQKFGHTIDEILQDGFEIFKKIETIPINDSPIDISTSMSHTMREFSNFWSENHYDLIFTLGDRYEMAAAVFSSIPFNLNIAHIHGGEVSAGAIDDKFRNIITLIAKLHFTSTQEHAKNVMALIKSDQNVFNVGALGLENISNIPLFTKQEFLKKFGFPLNNPILSTIHPETVNLEFNEKNILEYIEAMQVIEDDLVFTLPNADTYGLRIRELLYKHLSKRPKTYIVESLGTRGYFTCLKHCLMLIGNTSSGIIEAASFNKYVINLGDRQKGRATSENVISIQFNSKEIIQNYNKIKLNKIYSGTNIYGEGKVSEKIIKILKTKMKNENISSNN